MLKTYHGSCHCGSVRYEADIDLSEGTGRCNCTICAKRRFWGVTVKPDAFRLLAGADMLGDYQFGAGSVHHHFCRACGVATFGVGYVEQTGGAFTSIRLATLDDAAMAELVEAPIKYMDGRHDNWWNTPEDVRAI